ncbi:MAG: hypothetical protein HOQ28_05435 [Thermoleophilia bacterium]|nr:hypothetical protein [Thermoleophilia bacterium]
MRLLIVFFAVAAALLGAESAIDWRIDPFGSFPKPGAVDAARSSGCLLSQELVGNTYPDYKLTLFRRRRTRVFVIGSSRTVKISAHPGESTFTNMGIPNISPAVLLQVLRAIARSSGRPLTMYLGVEAFWFNPSFRGPPPNRWFDKLRYLLSGNTFRESLLRIRRAPWELTRPWRRDVIGGRCVIGRTNVSIAWRLDGSRLYGYELAPHLYHPQDLPFTRDLEQLDLGYYAGFDSLSRARLRQLVAALDLARQRGWRVVGFTPPNPTRYVQFLRTNPAVGPQWRAFSRLMPRLFHDRGFAWLGLGDVRSVPCAQNAFADGGFHANAACSATIRRRLDAAVRAER